MTKRNSTLAAVVVVVVLAVIAYLIFHKSGYQAPTINNTTASQNNAPAMNNSILKTKTASGVGQYLADPNGKPLYTYNADTSGVSNCTGSCLSDWPIYEAKGSTANLPTDVGTIKRSDNDQTQYTFKGLPLYYFTGDTQGRPTGNGIEDFSIATPSSAPSSSSQPSPAPSPVSPPTNNPYNY